jgi:Farnesoic acid 0-methyl transferase
MMAVALTEGSGGAIEQMHVATGWRISGRWAVSFPGSAVAWGARHNTLRDALGAGGSLVPAAGNDEAKQFVAAMPKNAINAHCMEAVYALADARAYADADHDVQISDALDAPDDWCGFASHAANEAYHPDALRFRRLTLLHVAVCNGRLDACDVLIEAGADVAATCEHGYTPRTLCEYVISHVTRLVFPQKAEVLALLGKSLDNINAIEAGKSDGSSSDCAAAAPAAAAAAAAVPAVEIMTSDNYDYTRGYVGRVPTGVTSALITVTASNDAHVALGDSLEHDGRHWEIVLGGWGNTQSVIRPRNQGPALATHHGAVLHAGAPRQFWVSWGDGSLRVGEGTAPGAREMMAVALTEGSGGAIEQMHVATGWGSSGRWAVSFPGSSGGGGGGGGGSAVSGVQFVRVQAPPEGDNALQISQLQVFDASGTNVALRRPCSTNSSYGDSSGNPANAVDGEAYARPHPAEFHSGNAAGDGGPGGWWEVDLGRCCDVCRIVFFNRDDCCEHRIIGAELSLLGPSRAVLATRTFDDSACAGAKTQVFEW